MKPLVASASTLLDTVLLPAVGSSNAGEFFRIAEPDIAFATLQHLDDEDLVVIDSFTFNSSGDLVIPEPTTSALALAALCLAMSKRRTF